MEKIIINPLTRISGFLEIQVFVQNNLIQNAFSSGLLFRGFELMLKGRPPLDAIYFTERICGICSTAHAMASTLALEDALKIFPDENDKMIREFMHGCEFLQNHLRHFYQYTLPDFVKGPEISPVYPITHQDYRLPESLNAKLARDYLQSVQYSRLAHEMLAVFGGKAPHNHGIFVGGVTVNINSADYIKVKSILKSIKEFVDNVMIEDVYILAEYYPELFEMGRGYGNLMSFGLYDSYALPSLTYVYPGVYINGEFQTLNLDLITENVYYSWYQGDGLASEPGHQALEPDVTKEQAYSWIKAPRYCGYPMEVGPLARMWLCGEYTRGISAMDRYIARVLETRKIINIMEEFLNLIELRPVGQRPYTIPESAQGVGTIDTTRGALGHWLAIQNQKIEHYDIITPTAWNLSPEDSQGVKGVTEQALIGTLVEDVQSPIEIGRIVRSYDPCVSCGTHVYGITNQSIQMKIL